MARYYSPEQAEFLKAFKRANRWNLRGLSKHLGVTLVRASSLERGLEPLTEAEARACGYQRHSSG